MSFFNILRFDFYKLIKSRILYIVYIAAFLLAIHGAVDIYFIKSATDYNYLQEYKNSNSFLTILVMVFAVLFVVKDYASTYIKNIYPSINKAWYIISKALYIILFCVLYSALEFYAFYLLGNKYGIGAPLSPELLASLTQDIKVKLLVVTLSSAAIGIFVMALIVLIKKPIPVFAPVILYDLLLAPNIRNYVDQMVFDLQRLSHNILPFSLQYVNEYNPIFFRLSLMVPAAIIILSLTLSIVFFKNQNNG